MIENTIFNNLVFNEEFARKTLPFLKADYFQNKLDKVLFKLIDEYVTKYNSIPTKAALIVELDSVSGTNDDEHKMLVDKVNEIKDEQADVKWLVDQTEKYCQDRAIYNAIMSSIQIINGNSQDGKGKIPTLLSDALGVSFDTHIGHDFLDDFESRFEFYHQKEKRVPFDLDYFNTITKGGLPLKTLNVALAGTGVGKSLFMCHCAAANLMSGKNVLYITMEMAEEKIAERIDANLLNEPMDMLAMLPKEAYDKKIERIKNKTLGKLIIKEYPTASAGAAHFRHLLGELKLKRNFVPDIIYVDYLNICMSSRLKYGSNVNSYTYIKSIAEEIRGLAVEFNVPIVSATQTTRSGYTNTDLGLEDTSESFGLPATADFMFALITSEELEDLGQILVKQLKNRYNDPSHHRKFVVGVDRSKMRLYNVEQSAQDDIIDDTPLFDRSSSGERIKQERKFDKTVFDEFK
jgi:archaellum biogenesis ATPase FlaH